MTAAEAAELREILAEMESVEDAPCHGGRVRDARGRLARASNRLADLIVRSGR